MFVDVFDLAWLLCDGFRNKGGVKYEENESERDLFSCWSMYL